MLLQKRTLILKRRENLPIGQSLQTPGGPSCHDRLTSRPTVHSKSSMTDILQTVQSPASCQCGSGLRPGRCCLLDWTQLSTPPQDVPAFNRAQAAFNTGCTTEA